jgi:hypothetical protein
MRKAAVLQQVRNGCSCRRFYRLKPLETARDWRPLARTAGHAAAITGPALIARWSAWRTIFLKIASAETWSLGVARDPRFETRRSTSSSVRPLVFLEPETEPAGGEAAVAVRLLPRDQCRQLEGFADRHTADLSRGHLG